MGITLSQLVATVGNMKKYVDDNSYEHPTTSGNKHIPSGGSQGQILSYANDGEAQWKTDLNAKLSYRKISPAVTTGDTET